MATLICCMECGRPWGVLLERGELPSDRAQQLAQVEMEEALVENLEVGIDLTRIVNVETAPEVEPQEVLLVTESLAAFASEYLNADFCGDPGWYAVDEIDYPAWLLKGRKRRWAYKWECCNLKDDDFVWSPQTADVLISVH